MAEVLEQCGAEANVACAPRRRVLARAQRGSPHLHITHAMHILRRPTRVWWTICFAIAASIRTLPPNKPHVLADLAAPLWKTIFRAHRVLRGVLLLSSRCRPRVG